MQKRQAAYVAALILLVFSYLGAAFMMSNLVNSANAQDEIMPVNPPQVQLKAIHILTANERSEILIHDIWKPPEFDRVKIGAGAALIRVASVIPSYPYGWQAFVAQDARSSWNGGFEAVAYGEM